MAHAWTAAQRSKLSKSLKAYRARLNTINGPTTQTIDLPVVEAPQNAMGTLAAQLRKIEAQARDLRESLEKFLGKR